MNRITRFDFAERAVHWIVAIAFTYAALSGLSLWSRKLFWIATILGGGSVVRALHPWGALVFAVALALMFRRWASHMRLDDQDRIWLSGMRKYMVNDEAGLPPPGKFNAGQKMMFWTQAALTLLLLASGLVLWFPEVAPRSLRLFAVLIHPLAAIAAIGGIIVHVYMGTSVVPGSMTAMIRGWVTERWAAAHHPRWKPIQGANSRHSRP
ncbi:MAG: formate dehydrogenase subunit gamma [Bryobacteraceae bacterium]